MQKDPNNDDCIGIPMQLIGKSKSTDDIDDIMLLAICAAVALATMPTTRGMDFVTRKNISCADIAVILFSPLSRSSITVATAILCSDKTNNVPRRHTVVEFSHIRANTVTR